MNKQKYFISLILSVISLPAFSQGVIYKCIDAKGDVTYSNDKSSGRCEKTNLGTVNKGNIVNKPAFVANKDEGNAPIINSNINTNIADNEQTLRDKKRSLILQGELDLERSQLKTVLEMLSKVPKGGDEKQLEQLTTMEKSHRRNIATLEKELGVSSLNLSKAKSTIPSNLPFALPKEANDVELVEAPKSPTEKVVAKPIIKSIPVAPIIQPAVKPVSITNNTSPKPVESKPVERFVPPPVIRQVMEYPLITNKSLKKKQVTK